MADVLSGSSKGGTGRMMFTEEERVTSVANAREERRQALRQRDGRCLLLLFLSCLFGENMA